MSSKEKAEALGIKVDGRWSEARILAEIEREMAQADSGREEVIPLEDNEMNERALRIWEGQSPSLPLRIRVERIVSRLKAKGYDTTGLVLPAKGYEKFL